MYIPKRWLLPLGAAFLFLIGFVWLLGQKATLEARIEALESQQTDAAELRALLATPASYGTSDAGRGFNSLGGSRLTLDAASLEEICGSVTSSGEAARQGDEAGAVGESVGNGGAEVESTIETTKEQGNYATNSGIVWDSMFVDGGFGDVAIMLYESQLNAPISISHQGGSNSSMSDSGNNEGDSTPTNVSHAITDSSTDTLSEVSTDTTVNASIGPDNAQIGDSSTGQQEAANAIGGAGASSSSSTSVGGGGDAAAGSNSVAVVSAGGG